MSLSYVLFVEVWVLGEDDIFDVEEGGGGYVKLLIERVVVECGVFGCYDGSGDEEWDIGVVNVGEDGDGVDIGDGIYGVLNCWVDKC